jgi:transcriptional regulator with XRE-family HTH domain
VKRLGPSRFGVRLKQAFEGSTNTEIARKLGVSNSTITDYVKGTSYPTADGLLKIAGITKCNIHWLLTGEGEADSNPLRFLDEQTRATVIAVASKLRITPEALISDMIDEALTRRAVEMVRNLKELDGSQVDQLRAILNLTKVSERGVQDASETRGSSPTVREGSV